MAGGEDAPEGHPAAPAQDRQARVGRAIVEGERALGEGEGTERGLGDPVHGERKGRGWSTIRRFRQFG